MEIDMKLLAENLGGLIVDMVNTTIAERISPLLSRMQEQISRVESWQPPRDGRDVNPEAIRMMVAEEVAKIEIPQIDRDAVDDRIDDIARRTLDAWPRPRDGRDVDMAKLIEVADTAAERAVKIRNIPTAEDVAARVMPALRAEVSAIPRPKDGENGKDAPTIDVDELVARTAALVPTPRDGVDAAPVDIEDIARRAASLVPKPQDGKDAPSIDIEDVAARAAAIIPKPKDGVNGKDGTSAAVDDALLRRVADLVPRPKDGQDGKSIDIAEMMRIVTDAARVAVDALPRAKDGQDGKQGEKGRDADPIDLDDVARRAAALVPTPRDGQNGKDATSEMVGIEVARQMALLPPAKDGRDVDMAEVRRIVDAEIALIPPAKDGRSADPEETRRLIADEVERRFDALPRPRDGEDGKGVDPEVVAELVRSEVEAQVALIPPALPGRDGRDAPPAPKGSDLEDIRLRVVDDRTIEFAFGAGNREVTRTVKIPALVYRGVFASGASHERGDAVTFGGSLWIAMRDTTEPPGEKASDWKLAVKKGRDSPDV